MIGGVAVREAPDSMFVVQASNGSNVTFVDEAARDARRVQVAVALTTLVGILQVGVKTTKHGGATLWMVGCGSQRPRRASTVT